MKMIKIIEVRDKKLENQLIKFIQTEKKWQSKKFEKKHNYVIAYNNLPSENNIIGYLRFEIEKVDNIYIHELHIKNELRRHGYGTTLLEKFLLERPEKHFIISIEGKPCVKDLLHKIEGEIQILNIESNDKKDQLTSLVFKEEIQTFKISKRKT